MTLCPRDATKPFQNAGNPKCVFGDVSRFAVQAFRVCQILPSLAQAFGSSWDEAGPLVLISFV